MKDTIKTPEIAITWKKPSWWTEHVEGSWNKVKVEALADWKKVVASEKKIENKVDEQALAFGHGAREAYHKLEHWSGELENKLKADWKETTTEAESAWDKVSTTVKHGWERAVGTATVSVPKAKA